MEILLFVSLLAVTGVQIQCKPLFKKRGRLTQQTDRYFHGFEDNAGEKNHIPKNGELFEGDIVMDSELRKAVLGAGSKRSGIIAAEVGKKKHWPNGIVPYVLSESLAPIIRARIHKAIAEFKEYTCIKFVPKSPSDEDYVVFKDGKGCSSSVGRIGGKQTIHLARGCKRIGTVLHEMMHSIGIIHEQSRFDRDRYVNVKFSNIRSRNAFNFQKYSIYNADNLGIPYNYWSVMHYSNYAFSRNGKPTIISKIYPRLRFGQRQQLSTLDVEEINRLYECKKKKFDPTILHDDMTPDQALEMRDQLEGSDDGQ